MKQTLVYKRRIKMIDVKRAQKYCRDDISKIENYEKAIADKSQTWDCHHRDEIRTLPSGITVIRSKQDLIENGRYYNCPANELIFLTNTEHRKLHNTNMSDETKKKMSETKKDTYQGEKNPFYGKTHSAETRQKMSEAKKGHTGYWTGKTRSDETRKKMREAWAKRKLDYNK